LENPKERDLNGPKEKVLDHVSYVLSLVIQLHTALTAIPKETKQVPRVKCLCGLPKERPRARQCTMRSL
jgi:hypothetical protein